MGRTPIIGEEIAAFVPWPHILSYCEAILRVYNLHGRRDNLYKARIKILVKALGIEEFRRQVEAEFAHLKDGPATLTEAEVARVARHFVDPEYATLPCVRNGRAFVVDEAIFSRPGPGSVTAVEELARLLSGRPS